MRTLSLCISRFFIGTAMTQATADNPEMVLLKTEVDVCGYDDVGLKRLTVKEIEAML